MKYINIRYWIVVLIFTGCKAGGNDTGVEYAPQMYHSVPYEPLTQMIEAPDGIIGSWYYVPNSTPYNDYGGKQPMNMREPVAGTIPRQNYSMLTNKNTASIDQPILYYNLHKDSVNQADALKNPLPETEAVLADGKELYLSYCTHCHGENGNGQGKVGQVYGGVASYQSRAAQEWTEGHIFHVITHGIRRMWPHGSQVNPEERWKIVRYVEKLRDEGK